MSKKTSSNIERSVPMDTKSLVTPKSESKLKVSDDKVESSVISTENIPVTTTIRKSKRLPKKPLKIDGIETSMINEVIPKPKVADKTKSSKPIQNKKQKSEVELAENLSAKQSVPAEHKETIQVSDIVKNIDGPKDGEIDSNIDKNKKRNKKWADKKNFKKNRKDEIPDKTGAIAPDGAISENIASPVIANNDVKTFERPIPKKILNTQAVTSDLPEATTASLPAEESVSSHPEVLEPLKSSKNKRRKKKKKAPLGETKQELVPGNLILRKDIVDSPDVDLEDVEIDEPVKPVHDFKSNLIKKADLPANKPEIKVLDSEDKSETNVIKQPQTNKPAKQENKPVKQENKPVKQESKPAKPENKPEVKSAKAETKPPKQAAKSVKKANLLYYLIPPAKQLTKQQLESEFLTNFLNKVEEYLKQQAYIEPGGKILIAVSGGVDSIVMMDAIAILANRLRFSFYVAHFNHKLRGLSADNDETLVRITSREYNVQYYASSGNVKQYSSKNSLSIEQAARLLRYNFFERTARNLGVDIVATAHTEDDLVETFFINLFRGSGLTGLSSMPSKRKFVKNVSLVRPFLQFSKKELYEYAKIRALKWNEDETNSLLNYTRNKVRHDLIPKLLNEYTPALIEIISRTTELMQGADEVIKDIVSKSILNVIDEANNERYSLRINMLLTFNKFMQGELIQHAWNKYFRLQPMPLSTIDRILDLTDSQTGSICEISSGYYVLRDRNNLIFVKRVKDISTTLIIEKPGEYKIGKYKLEITEVNPNQVVFNNDKNVEYISADLMYPFAEIRNKREGDNFHPLGAPGEMKLSDFLTNEKVSLIDKPNILVLTNKIDILWVLGHRISEKCRVNKSEKKIYKLKLSLTDKKTFKEPK